MVISNHHLQPFFMVMVMVMVLVHVLQVSSSEPEPPAHRVEADGRWPVACKFLMDQLTFKSSRWWMLDLYDFFSATWWMFFWEIWFNSCIK